MSRLNTHDLTRLLANSNVRITEVTDHLHFDLSSRFRTDKRAR